VACGAQASAPDFKARASLAGKEFTFSLHDALKSKEYSSGNPRWVSPYFEASAS
jgi:hypothetical protein